MNHDYCPVCGQTITYELAMDIGTAKMMKAIADYVREKGINVFSNTKEMIGVGYDFHAAGNITRPRAHGLIARIPGEATNYCITDKGFKFLEGEKIESIVVMKKATNYGPSYVLKHAGPMVSINDFMNNWGEYWSANGYAIKEGRVITRPTVKSAQQETIQADLFGDQETRLPYKE